MKRCLPNETATIGRAAILAALLCAWAGCNLAPNYARPTLDVPEHFRETAPAATADAAVTWTTAHPNDDARRDAWWEFYGDPQLSALVAQVEVSNQTILAAEANFRAARAAVASARSAFFPTIGVGAVLHARARITNLENAGGLRRQCRRRIHDRG